MKRTTWIHCILAVLIVAIAWPDAVDARRRRRRRRRRKAKTEKKLTGKKKARKSFRRGQKLFRQKKYREALNAFDEAYAIWKHPVIEFNIALCYAFLGHKITAAKYLKLYLAHAKGKERKLPPVLQKVHEQTGVLVVNTPDPKAEIFVDGNLVGRGKVEVILEVGKRTVDIRLGDRIAARKTIEVVPREERMWDLKEIPKPPPTPRIPEPRVIQPRTGTTGATPTPTPARTITVRRKTKGVHWAYFTAAISLAVAGAAAGVFMDFQTRKAHDDWKADQNNQSLKDKGVMYRNITIGMWGVTGAFGITAAVLAFFTRWRKYEKVQAQLSFTPTVSPGNVGLSLRWEQ